MSIPLGKRISICDKEFSDYRDLSKHMRFLLGEYIKGSGAVDNKHLIKSLRAFKESLVFGQHSDTYKYLLKENFQKVCIQLLKLCMDSEDMILLSALLSCLITITDNSKEMTEELVQYGLAPLVIDQTIQISMSQWNNKSQKTVTVDSLIEQLILLVDNIVSDARFQQSFINCKNMALFKEKISSYLGSKSHRTRILAMAALTWLIEEDEDRTRLDFYSKIIENFVEYINRGLTEKLRRCEGLRISEMLLVLKSLSNIESIKNAMLRMKKLMSLIRTILKSDKSTNEEIQIALGIMYNLSLRDVSDDNDLKFQADCDVGDVLKPFVVSGEPGIRRFANGLMSELNYKLKERKTEILYDIFISHCHTDEGKIQRISETLRKEGYRVWRAKDNIKGHEDCDIKETIEQARLLVMGVSNSYYNSECCHAECKYANELKKPLVPVIIEPKYKPKDWLGRMIHHETKIDFTNETEFDAMTERLVKHIESTFDRVGINRPPRPGLCPKMKSLSVSKSFVEEKETKLWSKEEVTKWLQLIGLTHLESNLAKYDGKMLEYLRKLKSNSPEQYSRRLKDDLNLSFEDEINFDEAIEKLKG